MDFLERLLGRQFVKVFTGLVALIRAALFVGSVAAASAVFLGLGISYLNRGDQGVAVRLLALALLVTGTSTYAYYFVRRKYDPAFYEIVELNGELTVERVNGHYRYLYERRQTVKATRDDLRLIEIRGHWTGQGSQKPDVQTTQVQHALLDGKRPERDGRVHRWIYPRRALVKGQEEEVGVIQTHEDDVKRQESYFREGGGRYKTHKLTVRITLPLSEFVSGSVKGRIWDTRARPGSNDVVGDIEFAEQPKHEKGSMKYSITVNDPKKYHSYGLEWVWQNEPPE